MPMINRSAVVAAIVGAVTLGLISPAHARLRVPYEDQQVVERSELIVVGHIKKDSIALIEHPRKSPDEGVSYEYRAILAVSETLKDECKDKEIIITIHYGLDPTVVGSPALHKGCDPVKPRPGLPKDTILIFDTGNSALTGSPLVQDAGKDNLWFLRKRSGTFGEDPGKLYYGIVDPEDLQSLSLKEYFLAYLSKDPVAALGAFKNPDYVKRAKRYLDHLEVQRIAQIPNFKARLAKLWPYYQRRMTWGPKDEVRDGMLACGAAAGPFLLEKFKKTDQSWMRMDLIRMLAQLQYDGAVDTLVKLLVEHDKFWAKQHIQGNSWNSDSDEKLLARRREVRNEVYYSIYALGQIGDARAADAIKLTKTRWEKTGFEDKQIVEACDQALKQIAEATQK